MPCLREFAPLGFAQACPPFACIIIAVASLHDQNDEPIFLCDAMLGGLARWLRAAGFDPLFEYGIDDREIIRRAMASALSQMK